MKTNLQNVRLTALIIAITATFVTQTVRAQVQSLVITENSSTSLTAILNGTTSLSVTNSGADVWFVAFPLDGQVDWLEPGASGVNNVVQGQSTRISVGSDLNVGFNGIPNGTTDTTHFTTNGSPINVTFNDNGDVASAPDTGSTLGLLALALAALVGASRLRSIRLA